MICHERLIECQKGSAWANATPLSFELWTFITSDSKSLLLFFPVNECLRLLSLSLPLPLTFPSLTSFHPFTKFSPLDPPLLHLSSWHLYGRLFPISDVLHGSFYIIYPYGKHLSGVWELVTVFSNKCEMSMVKTSFWNDSMYRSLHTFPTSAFFSKERFIRTCVVQLGNYHSFL